MKLKTTTIQGKQYVEVNERLKYFRATYPKFSLLSEVIEKTDTTILIKATIYNEKDRAVATGLAEEKAGSSFINKTSHVENCETSAWGRALGNLGIGLDTSVASAEEVQNAIANQKKKPADTKPKPPPLLSVTDAPEVILNIKRRLDNGLTWEEIKKEIKANYQVTSEQLKRLKTQANA
jgi:hypothetical protein|tara:strand:+ start:1108 stop:1644 length:537 start_codon:yes stop_codon:yes gene_type:complete